MARRASLGAIFLTIFLDLLGFGFVLPFLAEEARDTFHTTAFVGTLLSAVYSLAQFLFAPVWGRLSDRVGRRPVLIWSVAATAASNAALGLALAYGAGVGWLFLARVLAGVATANLAVASAYIADVTSKEDRAKGMGMIGMAFGLGFILGPGIGGFLAETTVNGRHGPLACFAAAGLSVINIVWVLAGLPESLPADKRGATTARRPSLLEGGGIGRLLSDGSMLRVVLSNFLLILSFSGMEQTFRYYNKDEFGMSLRESGGLLAFIGVMAAAVQGGLVRRLSGKVADAALVRWGLALQAVGFAVLAASSTRATLYASGALLAFGNGLAQPGISAYVSKRAKESEQGGALGVNQSASSLGRVFGPALGGLLYGAVSHASPYWVASVGSTVAFAIALGLAQSTSTQTS